MEQVRIESATLLERRWRGEAYRANEKRAGENPLTDRSLSVVCWLCDSSQVVRTCLLLFARSSHQSSEHLPIEISLSYSFFKWTMLTSIEIENTKWLRLVGSKLRERKTSARFGSIARIFWRYKDTNNQPLFHSSATVAHFIPYPSCASFIVLFVSHQNTSLYES